MKAMNFFTLEWMNQVNDEWINNFYILSNKQMTIEIDEYIYKLVNERIKNWWMNR